SIDSNGIFLDGLNTGNGTILFRKFAGEGNVLTQTQYSSPWLNDQYAIGQMIIGRSGNIYLAGAALGYMVAAKFSPTFQLLWISRFGGYGSYTGGHLAEGWRGILNKKEDFFSVGREYRRNEQGTEG